MDKIISGMLSSWLASADGIAMMQAVYSIRDDFNAIKLTQIEIIKRIEMMENSIATLQDKKS